MIKKILEFIFYIIKSIFGRQDESTVESSEGFDFELEKEENVPIENDESEIFIEEKEMTKEEISKNNSVSDDYHKQTNNVIDPFISCFPTSMVNAAESVKIKMPTDEYHRNGYVQDEDAYNWFLENNPECKAFWSGPAYKNYLKDPENHPRELYDVEVFAFNKWIGREVCKLVYGVKPQQIVDTLAKGGAVVTSGRFCGFGHVICIVGYKAVAVDKNKPTIDEVTHFIVDDSYGNPHNNYKPVGVGGNDVVWEKDKFLAAINKGSSSSPTYNGILFNV